MQRLRILTGRHAGAGLDLPMGVHDLGTDPDCEIAISDWSLGAMSLSVTDSGVVARWKDPKKGDRPQQHSFSPFTPMAFDDVVLCVGQPDAQWPTDLKLMNKVFQPALWGVAQRAQSRVRVRVLSVLAGMSLVAVCAVGSMALLGTLKAQEPVETPQALAQRAQHVLQRMGAKELNVNVVEDGVVVGGVVNDFAQSQTVNAALVGLASVLPIHQRFSVATEVAEAIRATAGVSDALIEYQGKGVFKFVAQVGDPQAVQRSLERARADMSEVVSRIDAHIEAHVDPLTPHKATPAVSLLSSYDDGELSVVQTRDGVKHLVLTEANPTTVVSKALFSKPPDANPRERR
jgi:type III secretion protein D